MEPIQDFVGGLTQIALKMLQEEKKFVYTEEISRIYPNGARELMEERRVYEPVVTVGRCEEQYEDQAGKLHTLHSYSFPDGRVYTEVVQFERMLPDPVLFLALQDKNGWVKNSLWLEQDVPAGLQECY